MVYDVSVTWGWLQIRRVGREGKHEYGILGNMGQKIAAIEELCDLGNVQFVSHRLGTNNDVPSDLLLMSNIL